MLNDNVGRLIIVVVGDDDVADCANVNSFYLRLYRRRRCCWMQQLMMIFWTRPVWPDSAIFIVLGDKITLKSSQIVWWLFGLEWNTSFLILNFCGDFWATFGKVWATFYINIWSHWTRQAVKCPFDWREVTKKQWFYFPKEATKSFTQHALNGFAYADFHLNMFWTSLVILMLSNNRTSFWPTSAKLSQCWVLKTLNICWDQKNHLGWCVLTLYGRTLFITLNRFET